MAEGAGRETPNLEVADSNLLPSKVLQIRGSFLFLTYFTLFSRFFRRFSAIVFAVMPKS